MKATVFNIGQRKSDKASKNLQGKIKGIKIVEIRRFFSIFFFAYNFIFYMLLDVQYDKMVPSFIVNRTKY